MLKKTLVISDLHLGSPNSQVDKLLKLLELNWSRIIVNGDLLDSGKFHRYSKKHWKVLSRLRKLSKTIPLFLISGNHDNESKFLSEILGLEFCDELSIESGSRKILFIHGDKFDNFIGHHPFITNIAANFYYTIQRFGFSKNICRWLKKLSKSWLNMSDNLANKSLDYIKDRYIDVICTGHVHAATFKISDQTNKHYWNSGSFCDDPCHYLTIDDDTGEIELKEI